jgi:hypothetical protein
MRRAAQGTANAALMRTKAGFGVAGWKHRIEAENAARTRDNISISLLDMLIFELICCLVELQYAYHPHEPGGAISGSP